PPRFDRYPPYETMPPANSALRPQRVPGTTNTQRPTGNQSTPPARVRMDRIVSLSGTEVRGQVLHGDTTPWAGARIMFVNLEKKDARQSISTNEVGAFQLQLAKGDWLVYVQGVDGRPIYQKTLDVREN